MRTLSRNGAGVRRSAKEHTVSESAEAESDSLTKSDGEEGIRTPLMVTFSFFRFLDNLAEIVRINLAA